MVARPTPGYFSQGAGRGLVPRWEDAAEDPVWSAGFPYCRGGCGPWGEHGVGAPEDPWGIWMCCGLHYVIVLAFEDCTPDLRRGPVAVCRWAGGVIGGGAKNGGAELGGAEGGVALGCGGLFCTMHPCTPGCGL